jgi:hypothetical protein
MKVYNIYMFRNDNGLLYIGFSYDVDKRITQHKKTHNIVEVKTLYQTKELEHAYDMEEYFIECYDSFNNGLNKTKDGKGIYGKMKSTTGFKFSEESKRKMSDSAKKRYKEGRNNIKYRVFTDRERTKISDTQRGIVTYSKLNPKIILEVKRLYKLRPLLKLDGNQNRYKSVSSLRANILSKIYDISITSLMDIVKGKTYKNASLVHKNSKLLYDDALKIRHLYKTLDVSKYMEYKQKRPYSRIFAEVYAKRFNVVPNTIMDIINNKIGSNIKPSFNKKIKTANGYEYFDGIVKNKHTKYLKIVFSDNTSIKCSYNHRFLLSNGDFVSPFDILDNDIVSSEGYVNISSIEEIKEQIFLYDIINAGKDYCYFTNGIVSHNCAFLSDKGTLIQSEVLDTMRASTPINSVLGMDFYTTVKNKRLGVSVDVAEGIGNGGDYSVIQCFDIDTLEQVAEFRNNNMTITMFTKHFIKVLMELDRQGAREIYYTIESNPIGLSVINLLENATHSILHKAEMISEYRSKRKGLLTTNKSKLAGCSQLKDFIEEGTMKLHSKSLLSELKFFVKRGASFAAESGMHDDLVMATVIFCNLLKELSRYDQDVSDTINKITSIDCMSGEEEPLPFLV